MTLVSSDEPSDRIVERQKQARKLEWIYGVARARDLDADGVRYVEKAPENFSSTCLKGVGPGRSARKLKCPSTQRQR